MSPKSENINFKAMVRRWLYMVVAIIAAALMPLKPVFSFQDDKGIIYVRSFSMTDKVFWVTQTELGTGIAHVTSSMPVKGLYYCYLAMLFGSILSLMCFFNDEWRAWICLLTAIAAGLYYVLMAIYAIRIADNFYATLYPNYMAILPAVVLQMMILTRQSVIHTILSATDEE